jgi:hypothetical protein
MYSPMIKNANMEAMQKMADSGLVGNASSPHTNGGIIGKGTAVPMPQKTGGTADLIKMAMMQQMMQPPGENAGPQDYISKLVGMLTMGKDMIGDGQKFGFTNPFKKKGTELIDPQTGAAPNAPNDMAMQDLMSAGVLG